MKRQKLTKVDYETLFDVAVGLTDRAIAKRRNLSVNGAAWRVQALYQRLSRESNMALNLAAGMEVFNVRTSILSLAILHELIDANKLRVHQIETNNWLYEEFGVN